MRVKVVKFAGVPHRLCAECGACQDLHEGERRRQRHLQRCSSAKEEKT